jgi:hypothetical protein
MPVEQNITSTLKKRASKVAKASSRSKKSKQSPREAKQLKAGQGGSQPHAEDVFEQLFGKGP